MIYKIACVGKIKEDYYINLINDYKNKIKPPNSLEIFQVEDEKIPKKNSNLINMGIIEKEGKKLLAGISKEEYVIALCIDGKKTKTKELTQLLKKMEEREQIKITFVIGGSLGLSNEVRQRADYKLSFSEMTFPHQLMRVMLCDQILSITCDR